MEIRQNVLLLITFLVMCYKKHKKKILKNIIDSLEISKLQWLNKSIKYVFKNLIFDKIYFLVFGNFHMFFVINYVRISIVNYDKL